MKYRLMVSFSMGSSYRLAKESEDINDLLKIGKEFDKKLLRWEIENKKGKPLPYRCKIFSELNRGNFGILKEELQEFFRQDQGGGR